MLGKMNSLASGGRFSRLDLRESSGISVSAIQRLSAQVNDLDQEMNIIDSTIQDDIGDMERDIGSLQTNVTNNSTAIANTSDTTTLASAMQDLLEATATQAITLTNGYHLENGQTPSQSSNEDDLPIVAWDVLDVWTLKYQDGKTDTQYPSLEFAAGTPLHNTDSGNFTLLKNDNATTSTGVHPDVKWVQVQNPGFYEVAAHFFMYAPQILRANVGVQIHIARRGNNNYTGSTGVGQIGATGYIRADSGHDSSTSSCTNTLWLYSGDRVAVQKKHLGNKVLTKNVHFVPGRSHFSIRKLAGLTPAVWIRVDHIHNSVVGKIRFRIWSGRGRLYTSTDYISTDTPLYDTNEQYATGVAHNTLTAPFLLPGRREYYVHFEALTAGTQLGRQRVYVYEFTSSTMGSISTTVANVIDSDGNSVVAQHLVNAEDSVIATAVTGNTSSGLFRLKNPYPMNKDTTATQGTGTHVFTFNTKITST